MQSNASIEPTYTRQGWGWGEAQVVRVSLPYLNSGMHDEAGDMHRAGLAHAVSTPHCLLQDGRVHAGLQQEHMVSCKSPHG